MDRALIESDPHRLLEGMMIAAYGIGASKAYVYIRAEYPLAVERLREAIEQAKAYGLVGDDIMIGLVAERIQADDARDRGYILDGFPRTVAQAVSLDEITASHPLDVVVDLVVPRDLVLSRLSARRVCRDCGANFQATGTEPSPWTCENCGGDVVQRDDDTPDAINKRLDLYETQTQPLIDFYGESGRLAQIDGVGSPDEVFARLTKAVEQRL
jgi:adenylate kinase